MRLSISELTTYRWDFDQDIQEYANTKYDIDAVGVWRQKVEDYGTDAAIDLITESGIGVSSLMWTGGFTGSAVYSYEEAIADGIEAIRLASALGAECLIAYTGPRAGHTHNHARRLAARALGRLADVANDYDVTIAVEPTRCCVADIWSFLNNIDDTLEFLDSIPGNDVKMVFDTYHMAYRDFDASRMADIAPRTALVQLSDSQGCCQDDLRRNEPSRCRLGQGSIPIADVVAAFESHGYGGYYEVELIGPAIQGSDYHELLNEIGVYYDYLGVKRSKQTNRSLPRT